MPKKQGMNEWWAVKDRGGYFTSIHPSKKAARNYIGIIKTLTIVKIRIQEIKQWGEK